MDLNTLINDDKWVGTMNDEMSDVEEDDNEVMTTNQTDNSSAPINTRSATPATPNAPKNL